MIVEVAWEPCRLQMRASDHDQEIAVAVAVAVLVLMHKGRGWTVSGLVLKVR